MRTIGIKIFFCLTNYKVSKVCFPFLYLFFSLPPVMDFISLANLRADDILVCLAFHLLGQSGDFQSTYMKNQKPEVPVHSSNYLFYFKNECKLA